MDEKNLPEKKKRKNYPGDTRTPGTKDYGMILSNLMNYRNQLFREKDEQNSGKLFLKIREKLKELGFEKAAETVKNKAGRRKLGKFQEISEKKKEAVLEIADKYWHEGKQKHAEARE